MTRIGVATGSALILLLLISSMIQTAATNAQQLTAIGIALPRTDGLYDIVADSNYVYVAGKYGSSAFVSVFDSNWNIVWSRTLSRFSLVNFGDSIAVHGGSIYVAGYFMSSYPFSRYRLSFVAKFRISGELEWVYRISVNGDDIAYGVAVSPDGYIYVVGRTDSCGNYCFDAYIAKIAPDGNLVWFKTIGGNDYDSIFSATVSPDGYIYVVGYTKSFWQGDYDIFVAKIAPDGNLVWSRTVGTDNDDYGYGIAISPYGSIYVVGSTFNAIGGYDALVATLDMDGNLKWIKAFGGSDYEEAFDVAVSPDGYIYVVGKTYSFGAGNSDAFVAKISPLGSIEWFRTMGGSDYDTGKGITIKDRPIAVGYYDPVGGSVFWGYTNVVSNVSVVDLIGSSHSAFASPAVSEISPGYMAGGFDLGVASVTPQNIYGAGLFETVSRTSVTIPSISVTIYSVNFTIPSPEFPTAIGIAVAQPGLYSPQSLLVLALFLGVFIIYSKLFSWAQSLAVASAISLAVSIALLGTDLVAFFLVLLVLGLSLWRVLGK